MDIDKFDKLEQRLIELEKLIADPQVISKNKEYKIYLKEHGFLVSIVNKYRNHKNIIKQINNLVEMQKKSDIEPELLSLAKEEEKELLLSADRLSKELENISKGEGKINEDNIIIEIRAGAGGDEAALFAADLFRMYTRYAEAKKWQVELIDSHSTGLKGFKEVIFSVEGKGAYSNFKYESGAHRVQRVPVTETSGRIHTSAATVAVLPQVGDVELKIKEQDLRIDTFRASGHGGQHLQKTDSAVRITHLPTGMVVQCQDERSQLKNREKAMKYLRARLYQKKKNEQETFISDKRRQQIGTGDRSEKIRTYNFPQNRVTDHRINFSLHNLESVLDGEMDKLIDALKKST